MKVIFNYATRQFEPMEPSMRERFALGGGVDQLTQQPVERPQEIIDRGKDGSMTVMSIAPLMHGAAQWSCISRAFEGGKVVIMPQFSADKTWQLIEQEQVNSVFIVGDAMARPMIESFFRES